MDVKDINTKSANYVGKVRSNFLGTEFAVYDDGQNPRDIKSGRRETARKQMGICLYASNVLGSRGT
jgi:tubby-related protein 1